MALVDEKLVFLCLDIFTGRLGVRLHLLACLAAPKEIIIEVTVGEADKKEEGNTRWYASLSQAFCGNASKVQSSHWSYEP